MDGGVELLTQREVPRRPDQHGGADAELFKNRVLDAASRPATPVRWLVVAAEQVTSVDVTAADTVAERDKT